MRARIRFIAPLAFAVALTAACGESGSSGTDGGGGADSAASGSACTPVEGDRLVVLEDDKNLQNADNIIPAVTATTAESQPALLTALNAVSAAMTTDDLIELNAAVDVERRSAEEVAAEWVEQSGVTEGLEQGSGPISVGGGNFSESTILANVYAEVLTAAGFDATAREVGSRELYLDALIAGTDIQVFPEYLATVTESLNTRVNGANPTPVASPDVEETVAALEPLAAEVGLAFGEPSEAADQNAFAVTQEFADKLGVSTLSELAEACDDGSLILGGPSECPERPFCQVGLEKTYGLAFDSFRELGDAGGPLTKAAITQGEVSVGLVLTSSGELAQN